MKMWQKVTWLYGTTGAAILIAFGAGARPGAVVGIGLVVCVVAAIAVTSYARANEDPADREKRANTLYGITLLDGRIESAQGSGPVRGATARVETAGQITSRISATRLITLGPFALFARKKVDQRELYLTIEGQGFAIVQRLNAATEGLRARQFAARINVAAGTVPEAGDG